MKIGIIGLPQTGKKKLFSVLTGQKIRETELGQGTPISGVAEIRDLRFDRLVAMYKPKKAASAKIDIEILPKIDKENIANGDIFKDITNSDAICHVVRCFVDDSVYHVDGTVDPKRDIDLVNSELILNDLIFIDKRLERIEKNVKKLNDETSKKEKELLLKMKIHLEKGLPLRIMEFSNEEEKIMASYSFMTRKEIILALNVSEENINNADFLEGFRSQYNALKADLMQFSAKLESEIAEIKSENEKQDFLSALGIKEPAINILTRLCLKSLNLISFFTVGSDEVKQWIIKAGASAPAAAGAIHSDLQKGFIRAEVMKYDDLIEFGSEENVKDAGKFYLKGRDYVVNNGDIMSFRFSV